MSGGLACRTAGHRARWWVVVRRANYSAFAGRRRTPSAYSEVACGVCQRRWRTRAAYVARLPDTAPDPTTGRNLDHG